MKVTFLGTGGSQGVPVIGCKCPICLSDHWQNKRLRPSILIEIQNRKILVDTTPDFRQQALAANIERLDAILFTHAHADHIMGFDDLRVISWFQKQTIPIYSTDATLERINKFFGYMVNSNIWQTDIERFDQNIVTEPFNVAGLDIVPVPVLHNTVEVLGFLFNNKCAYLTDLSFISVPSKEIIKGVETLIISCVRKGYNPKHLVYDKVIELVEELKPKRAILTHISHELDHFELQKSTPEYIMPAFDGMVIDI